MTRPPPASGRRRAGRWRVAGWLLATAGVTGWWAAQPLVDPVHVPVAALCFAVLLGAALATA